MSDFSKTIYEKYSIEIDFSDTFEDSEEISSSTVEVLDSSENDVSTDIIDSDSSTSTSVIFVVKGGRAGIYDIYVKIISSLGYKYQESKKMRVYKN